MRPIDRLGNQSCCYWVAMDITRDMQQITILLDMFTFEATLKQYPHPGLA